MRKALTIASVTFREGVRQPFYLLVVLLVLALLILHYFLPFFTLGKDIRMFKEVCLGYMLLGLLLMSLLLAGKVVDEEIENRTTLTLMSKPVRRWELIVGKYLGVMAAVTLALIVFALVLIVATRLRVPEEMRVHPDTIDEKQFQMLEQSIHMHTMSLIPACTLLWMQIAVMTAVAVAISTRAPMVLNMVAGFGIFLAAHLTPFLERAVDGAPAWQRGLARVLVILLPYLENFNLNPLLIFKDIVFAGASPGIGQVAYGQVWHMVGLAGLYAAGYIAFMLSIALALFRTRELG
ncbi:MAG: hypothetical protein BIFFINMI_00232 [Phycisphaerae bacterium]|nr:hypothetical protein [Phycisphaerae bacterium]